MLVWRYMEHCKLNLCSKLCRRNVRIYDMAESFNAGESPFSPYFLTVMVVILRQACATGSLTFTAMQQFT